MIRATAFWLAVITSGAAAQVATQSAPGAILRGLDKFSGEVVDIELLSGETRSFERLEITLTECRYPAGNPAGDAYAGLQIIEVARTGVVFSGWMIASAPALSAMEHPRYDVWVIRCATS